VIGAAGKIANQVLPAMRERYELTLLDLRDTNRQGQPVEGVQVADLLNPDRDTYRSHFTGVDAVVHFGFASAGRSDTDAYFQAELSNVQMAYNVYQTSVEEGVRRVVVASSNHAADYYEALILDGQRDFIDPDGRAQSDNYYGWAKEVYEHLGFVFAAGKQSVRPLENVHIRIGGPRETDVSSCEPGDMRCVRRALGAYISERDMQQLFVRSIEAEDIRDEQGVPFQIFYGISDNSRAFWSIVNARKVIGYEPQDNSEIRFADL
ncbi:uncharacterized protein METZ01_LOCUS241757, partial [marine metagenome]